MNVAEAIETRIEIREYRDEAVDDDEKRAILDAGRLAPSGRNLQHWRFVLVDDEDRLPELGAASPTGSWIADADFAVAVCTDPARDFHGIDAGRAITHMQFAAWERGIGSAIYTVDRPEVDELLAIPDEYDLALVAGFGYPTREIRGVKNRKPLEEVAFRGRFGEPIDL